MGAIHSELAIMRILDRRVFTGSYSTGDTFKSTVLSTPSQSIQPFLIENVDTTSKWIFLHMLQQHVAAQWMHIAFVESESEMILTDKLRYVGQHSKHEHPVISAFDLFSIGSVSKSVLMSHSRQLTQVQWV